MSAMEHYLVKLFLSPLPVPLWLLVALWLAVNGVSLALASRALRSTAAEQHIVVPAGGQPQLTPRTVALHLALAIAVFAYAFFAKGAWASVFAGGWLVAAAVGLALNLRNMLLMRARSTPGSVRGRVDLSVYAALNERAADLWAGVVWCALAAIVAPHPAFLGGAWILGCQAAGLARRAHRASQAVAA